MEQVKAPEKIYMTPSFGEPDNVLLASFSKSHLNFHRDIEYIRTDVFIEKAEDFIRKKICDYIVHYNYGSMRDMETMYVDGRFFDDFKNYIKEN